uniref:Uncharacterized protein n=1 Tax=Molossus molossus TaxID=27622 RepID=A0A7J8JVR6_MOLMO|nr:hypothetical protein HJG59_007940 [Molossus molossus]
MHDLCVCVGGGGRAAARGERAGGSTGTRARRALGDSQHLPVTGVGAPGPSPSDNTTLTLSPSRGATYTAEATNRGEGGSKTVLLCPTESECLLRLLLLLRRLLPSSPLPPPGPSPPPPAAAAGAAAAAPPTTSGQLRGCSLRQTSAVSAAPLLCYPQPSSLPRAVPEGRLRQTSAVSAAPLLCYPQPSSLPRAVPEGRLRQTSARSGFPVPLRPGSPPREPSVLSGCRCFSSRSRPGTFQFKESPAWGPAGGWSQGPRDPSFSIPLPNVEVLRDQSLEGEAMSTKMTSRELQGHVPYIKSK